MWLSVALPAVAGQADTLSDALLAAGAISVSVEDALAGTPEETPQFGEPDQTGCVAPQLWQQCRVIALFESGEGRLALQERVVLLCRSLEIDMLEPLEIDEIAEQNWVQITQAQFEPIRINDRMWIIPSWHEAPDPAAINLILDPGMAFGTGSHPTTQLCLEWLCDRPMDGVSLLDYGCGSGILAIAAAKLGAGAVLGVDIDAQALQAARGNAIANDVDIDFLPVSETVSSVFECVVANILTNALCVLAPLLASRVATDGCIALSGVLESQADEVIAAYSPFIPLHVGAVRDGWVRLDGRRGAAS